MKTEFIPTPHFKSISNNKMMREPKSFSRRRQRTVRLSSSLPILLAPVWLYLISKTRLTDARYLRQWTATKRSLENDDFPVLSSSRKNKEGGVESLNVSEHAVDNVDEQNGSVREQGAVPSHDPPKADKAEVNAKGPPPDSVKDTHNISAASTLQLDLPFENEQDTSTNQQEMLSSNYDEDPVLILGGHATWASSQSIVFLVIGMLLGGIGMVFTAWRVADFPDGPYAALCRMIITTVGFFLRLVLFPCRSCLKNPYQGHIPVATMDYGFKDPSLLTS